MRITGPGATSPLERVATTPAAQPAKPASATSSQTEPERLVASLTDSDKSFLLNTLGMTVTARGNFTETQMPAGLSEEEGKARQTIAAQLMFDRERGAIEGNVSPSYLKDLLERRKDDSTEEFQDLMTKSLEYLLKGDGPKRVDTQA